MTPWTVASSTFNRNAHDSEFLSPSQVTSLWRPVESILESFSVESESILESPKCDSSVSLNNKPSTFLLWAVLTTVQKFITFHTTLWQVLGLFYNCIVICTLVSHVFAHWTKLNCAQLVQLWNLASCVMNEQCGMNHDAISYYLKLWDRVCTVPEAFFHFLIVNEWVVLAEK